MLLTTGLKLQLNGALPLSWEINGCLLFGQYIFSLYLKYLLNLVWHKVTSMEHPVSIEITINGLQVKLVGHYTTLSYKCYLFSKSIDMYIKYRFFFVTLIEHVFGTNTKLGFVPLITLSTVETSFDIN